ncbi:MAG TPA: polyprenyl synthetase family protein [Actinocrinis sp.]|nr:polyprenyl synthetase family protein [Actinocrinis sp.]
MTVKAPEQEIHPMVRITRSARRTADPRLHAAVAMLPDTMRHIGGDHVGRWERHGVPHSGGRGKTLRPAPVLAAARAVGGDSGAAMTAADAAEVVHNFTLVHDDVMDADLLRRHRPMAWTACGDAEAILTGDAMQVLAAKILAQDLLPRCHGGDGPPGRLHARTVRRAERRLRIRQARL